MTASHARVLIVDDDPVSIMLLDGMLRDDYEISVALSGEQALKRVIAAPPDLILLDVQMDGLDGYDICRHLKQNEHTRDIPVIFVTGRADTEEEIRGLELGAVDYIAKPFHPLIVRVRLKNHLELKRQRDLLNRLSSIDGLTGIANRRYFDRFLAQEWNRTVRGDDEISLMMIDVDHFKKFNDRYGHVAGDDCLKAIARALSGALPRSTDLVARFGGEEFVCVLTSTGAEGAAMVGEKLRNTIASLSIPHADQQPALSITASIGAATARPGADDLLPEHLLRTADRQLYRAKEAGRNQVFCAPCASSSHDHGGRHFPLESPFPPELKRTIA